MFSLNFPKYSFSTKQRNDKSYIFDPIRKKQVTLTPEEWVRQHVIRFLMQERQVPKSLIAVEMSLSFQQMARRCDIVVFNRQGKACLIVECKAPTVRIRQEVFDQIARYNMVLRVNYLLITNGLQHFCCHIDFETNEYRFLETIPAYKDLIS